MNDLTEYLQHAEDVRDDCTATMVDHAEDVLRQRTVLAAHMALIESGPTKGLDEEPLGAVMAGETNPDVIEEALLDAKERLAKRGALRPDIEKAIVHVIDYLHHRREILEARRKAEAEDSELAELEQLVQRMKRCGLIH